MSSSPSSHPPFDVHRVAVIGAGPAGLIAAKYLLARPSVFTHVVVFEQQADVGGVWNHSREPPPACPVPSTSPFVPPDDPIAPAPGGAPLFASAMYDRLHANIPAVLMRCVDKPFPPDAKAFPSREAMLEYLVDYGAEVRRFIRFGQRVEQVRLRVGDGGRDQWDVVAREVTLGGEKGGEKGGDVAAVGSPSAGPSAETSAEPSAVEKETFDAVVVAVGRYNLPFVADVPGIREFHEAHPGIITHSKAYRNPDDAAFRSSKVVVVVGNGPSGLDIARQIGETCLRPVLLSVRSPTPAAKLAHTGATEVPQIESFVPASRAIRFSDGRVETDIGAVVLCTGFLYSFPFLAPDLAHDLLGSSGGRSVRNLFHHLFHVAHPTLVFAGLPLSVVPFPLCEVQAGLVAAVWANAVALPATDEMAVWSRRLEEERGGWGGGQGEKSLQRFGKGEDGLYINRLAEWVGRATGTGGKEVPVWDDEMLWVRRVYSTAKLRFEQTGCEAMSLEELGLVYESLIVDEPPEPPPA